MSDVKQSTHLILFSAPFIKNNSKCNFYHARNEKCFFLFKTFDPFPWWLQCNSSTKKCKFEFMAWDMSMNRTICFTIVTFWTRSLEHVHPELHEQVCNYRNDSHCYAKISPSGSYKKIRVVVNLLLDFRKKNETKKCIYHPYRNTMTPLLGKKFSKLRGPCITKKQSQYRILMVKKTGWR